MAVRSVQSALRHLHTRYTCTYRQLRLLSSTETRHFLSPAYRCDEAWNKRLDNPLVSSVNLGDFYYDLDQKYKREGKVSAIDVDLFMNRIDDPSSEGLVEEIEEMVRRLRRSPETIKTLASTQHAVLRVLLDGKHTQTLLCLLDQPLMYGIFPDHHTCNLLLDTFLECQNYTAAARLASYLMLQEDFGPPLTQALALAACYCYVTSEDNPSWEDYSPKVEEPKDEVKIRVRYLRNPYFDDHFDLKEPNHIIGKTLAWLSPQIGGLVGRSCEVLGWALYNKWIEVEAVLDRLRSEKKPIAASVVSKVKELIGGVDNAEVRENLLSSMGQLEAEDGGVVKEDLWTHITQLLQVATKEAEPLDIKAQEEKFRKWEEQREQEYQQQVEEYRKKQLLAEIKHKKEDLAAREEVIFFFDNEKKLEMLLPERKYYPKKKSLIYPRKKNPRQVDEGYIPPEI